LLPNDTVFSGKDFFLEKSKRIRVGIDNGYYRSNAREMFTILSSEDLSKLDKVTVYHDNAKGRKIYTLNSENVEDL
jgi:hypothetical protein